MDGSKSSKATQVRKRLDEQSWRAVFERFEDAAMTVQEFCLREGLTRSVFMRWRARLRSSSTPPPASAKAELAAPKPSFVDLGLLGGVTATTGASACASPSAQHTALELRIELGAGISLHLVRR